MATISGRHLTSDINVASVATTGGSVGNIEDLTHTTLFGHFLIIQATTTHQTKSFFLWFIIDAVFVFIEKINALS